MSPTASEESDKDKCLLPHAPAALQCFLRDNIYRESNWYSPTSSTVIILFFLSRIINGTSEFAIKI
jgi:hypothetical protein